MEDFGTRGTGGTDARGVIWSALLMIAGALLLHGCAGGGRPAPSGHSGARPVTLTNEQAKAVEGGVKQMVANPQSAKLSAVTAITLTEAPGVHVCGYVTSRDAGGGTGPDLPFYVELAEADGKPFAARGQVGSDPSKSSKVRFMCRRNG